MNVVIIDYYKPNEDNGICSYRKYLTSFLQRTEEIDLYVVLLCCPNLPTIQTRADGAVTLVEVPFDIVANKNPRNEDSAFVNYVSDTIDLSKRTLIHLNWMNHAYIGPLFRQRIPQCKVLLTKHCVSWRENVIKNYELFIALESTLKGKISNNVFVKRILRDEITFFSLVDHIITVTNDAAEILYKLYGVPQTKVSKIYNGVATRSPETIDRQQLRNKFGFNNDDKIILFVGKLIAFKGLHLILPIIESLAQEISSLRLVICGDGYFKDVMSIIPKSLLGRVSFMGVLNKATLFDVYQLADIGIVPSIEEQCSYVVLEMMQSGLTVMVSDVPGIKEIIPPKFEYNFIPIEFNADGIYVDSRITLERIKHLLFDTHYVKRFNEEAHRLLETKFSSDIMCRQTLRAYCQAFQAAYYPNECLSKSQVSVVIPAYNCGNTIVECVQSVLSQQGVEMLDVIVVDDCSTDNTRCLLEKITDKRLRILVNDKHRGVAESLNLGVAFSQSKYVARIDADDIMLPGRLSKQAKFLDENPLYMIVGSNMFLSDNNLNIIGTISYPENDEEIKNTRFILNPFGHPAVMVRRSVFDKNKYELTYRNCEDYHLWNRILSGCKAYNIQENLTVYRIHSKSVSAVEAETQHRNTIELMLKEIEDRLNMDLTPLEEMFVGAFSIGAPMAFWSKYEDSVKQLLSQIVLLGNSDEKKIQSLLMYECAKHHLL